MYVWAIGFDDAEQYKSKRLGRVSPQKQGIVYCPIYTNQNQVYNHSEECLSLNYPETKKRDQDAYSSVVKLHSPRLPET